MNYIISKASMEEVRPLLEEYFITLNGVTDDFWEVHVLNAELYQITIMQKAAGCFAIYHKERITQFYLQERYLNLSQSIFKQILEDYKVKTAYVATGDQLFLSLCLDFNKKIELQAYFFDGTVMGEVRPPEYPRECIYEVDKKELGEVLAATGDFFEPISEKHMEMEEMLLYKLCDNQEVLGYGIIVPNKLRKQYWPCGMITLEKNRRNGVGRSIQMHLGDICRERGFTPISGCWYYNHLSKKTIESAGRYTKTRLLNVTF